MRAPLLPALFATAILASHCPAQDAPTVQPQKSTNQKPANPKDPTPKRKSLQLRMRDGLRFDPPRLSVKPGEPFSITVENVDSTHQTHNLVLTQPGKMTDVVQLALSMGEAGPARNFVPESSAILASTKILNPDQKASVQLAIQEPGVYPYVCTFPGHGAIMYGALYVGVPLPPLAKDPNVPPTAVQSMLAGGGRRPFVQRIFMPNSGPAAIAVALENDLNFCWDAGACKLRYAWKGPFIDGSAHWRGNGRELASLPADPWWSAPPDFPLRFNTKDAPPPHCEFLGYKIEKGLPEFHFRADGVEVFEKISATPDSGSLQIRFRIPNPTKPVVPIPQSNQLWTTSGGPLQTSPLTPSQSREFFLSIPKP